MSSELHIKNFNHFMKIKNVTRSAVEAHIKPLLNGNRMSWKDDHKLKELYVEWQAACAAFSAALNYTPYPNEYVAMPKMPIDDEEHQPCRQMAAVLILRTIYNDDTAAPWFAAAAETIKANISCAEHFYTCACKEAIYGWTSAENLETVKKLNAFYDSYYDEKEKKVKMYPVPNDMIAEMRKNWVYLCYQKLGKDVYKHTGGEPMHGWYKVTKTDKCYEFMIMETEMQHPSWRQAIAEKKIQRFPLDMEMGVKGTSFEAVTPDKIHTS